MSEPTTTTAVLAIYGAVLSSFTLGWNLYRDYIQRGRLRVVCYVGHIVGDAAISSDKNWLMWRVTNIGKEPVVLTHVGGSFGKTHFMINTREPLPVTLKPGEYYSTQTDDFSILEGRLEYLSALDSLGRTFKASKKSTREMKRKYAAGEYRAKGAI